jgi:hypothetical protein
MPSAENNPDEYVPKTLGALNSAVSGPFLIISFIIRSSDDLP